MEKNREKLPFIRPNMSQTVGSNIHGKIRVSNVDLEIQNHKRNKTVPFQERQTHWSSSQIAKKREEIERARCFESRLKILAEISRSTEPSGTDCYSDRKFALPLRRHYSEPCLLDNYSIFAVRAKSLKLNERAKDKENPKKTFTDFLPSVFFDTRLSNDNTKTNISSFARLKTREKSPEKSRRSFAKSSKNKVVSKGKGNREVFTSRKVKEVNHANTNNSDLMSRNYKKLLPKRCLSEQIDDGNYEINHNNDKLFPRRITIRTSQSCPTIVIHECGDEEENTTNKTNDDMEANMDSPAEQINGGKSLKKDTTSFVACWRPKQSIVNGRKPT